MGGGSNEELLLSVAKPVKRARERPIHLGNVFC